MTAKSLDFVRAARAISASNSSINLLMDICAVAHGAADSADVGATFAASVAPACATSGAVECASLDVCASSLPDLMGMGRLRNGGDPGARKLEPRWPEPKCLRFCACGVPTQIARCTGFHRSIANAREGGLKQSHVTTSMGDHSIPLLGATNAGAAKLGLLFRFAMTVHFDLSPVCPANSNTCLVMCPTCSPQELRLHSDTQKHPQRQELATHLCSQCQHAKPARNIDGDPARNKRQTFTSRNVPRYTGGYMCTSFGGRVMRGFCEI